MFIDDVLDIDAPTAPYTGAGSNPLIGVTLDFEDGPVALGNTSEGLEFQVWSAFLDGDFVWVSAPNTLRIPVLANPDRLITSVSIAFNTNAELYVAYTEGGIAKLLYPSPTDLDYAIYKLEVGANSPRITLDNHAPLGTSRSDVILSYINAQGELAFRKQREAFQIERVLDSGPYVSLERMYMNTHNRLQWEVAQNESDNSGTYITPSFTYGRKLYKPERGLGSNGYVKGEYGALLGSAILVADTPLEVVSLVWDNYNYVTLELESDVTTHTGSSRVVVYLNGVKYMLVRPDLELNVWRCPISDDNIRELNKYLDKRAAIDFAIQFEGFHFVRNTDEEFL